MNHPNEILLSIIGFEKYSISNIGKIHNGTKYLSVHYDKYDHAWSRTTVNGKVKYFFIPILTATYFLPNPDNLPCVCYKNGNRKDCRSINLYWGKQAASEVKWNIETDGKGKTSNFHTTELEEKDVLEIFAMKGIQREIAVEYNVSRQLVNQIINGRKWGWLTKHPKWVNRMQNILIDA